MISERCPKCGWRRQSEAAIGGRATCYHCGHVFAVDPNVELGAEGEEVMLRLGKFGRFLALTARAAALGAQATALVLAAIFLINTLIIFVPRPALTIPISLASIIALICGRKFLIENSYLLIGKLRRWPKNLARALCYFVPVIPLLVVATAIEFNVDDVLDYVVQWTDKQMEPAEHVQADRLAALRSGSIWSILEAFCFHEIIEKAKDGYNFARYPFLVTLKALMRITQMIGLVSLVLFCVGSFLKLIARVWVSLDLCIVKFDRGLT